MNADPFLLSRLQFALNISFHILFPTLTIALGWMLVYFKLRHGWSGAAHAKNLTGAASAVGPQPWLDLYFFFTKIFALTFALGVVSGITMSFQFGTNWPGFMNTVGNVAGPMLAFEVLTAFFLEASFLGIMLYGFKRVPGWVHTGATVLVALGTTFSAFWILALNSWMHTPDGHEIRDGVVHAVDWMRVVFNPSMPYRLAHVVLASGLTCAFFMAGLSAWRLLKGDRAPMAAFGLRTGVFLAAVLVPLQMAVGDLHGVNTVALQPQKVAAMEGLWDTTRGAPLVLFALPDEARRENRFALEIPKLSSIIITRSLDGEVQGLNDFQGNHPPVAPVFWGFRVMVGTGLAMLCAAWASAAFLWRRGSIPKPLLWALVAMIPSGWIATLAGWYVTEIGRQPWLVQGVLKAADAVGAVPGAHVAATLAAYALVSAFLLGAYALTIRFLAAKSIAKGGLS